MHREEKQHMATIRGSILMENEYERRCDGKDEESMDKRGVESRQIWSGLWNKCGTTKCM